MVLSMDRWIGKVAVVTGASAGIGAAISEQLVEHGLKVVGLARRKDRIEDLSKKLAGKKGKLYALKTDITKEEDILNAFKWIKENVGPVHILINNAGLLQPTSLTKGDTEMWKRVLDVNVLGLCIATREAVKDMQDNKVDGHIVHINSLAGHKVYPIPTFNIYTASKFAVTALAEALRLELNNMKTRIKITSISPGATDTEFLSSNNIDTNEESISKVFGTTLRPEDVADAIIYALSTPPHVQIQELMLRCVVELS